MPPCVTSDWWSWIWLVPRRRSTGSQTREAQPDPMIDAAVWTSCCLKLSKLPKSLVIARLRQLPAVCPARGRLGRVAGGGGLPLEAADLAGAEAAEDRIPEEGGPAGPGVRRGSVDDVRVEAVEAAEVAGDRETSRASTASS